MTHLLTAAEIAKYLGVPVSTIYKWTHEGFIPHVKLGKLLRFRLADVERWVEKRSKTGRLRRGIHVL